MKLYHFVLVILFLAIQLNAQTYNSSVLDTSHYFEFHNNYWTNLHHFLYQKASGSQLSKLQQDGNDLLIIGEQAVHESLNKRQQSTIDNAIDFYKTHLIQKGLLRGLGRERYWLQKQGEAKALLDSTVSKEFVAMLNHVSKTYKETFWPIHKKHNQEVLKYQLPKIRKLEKQIISRMEKLSLSPWPKGEKVRVDLTTYANYAGAYTPTRPIFNVVISTIDPRATGLDFLETIFHEGSHLLFRFESPWRNSIFESHKAGDYSIKFPRHLWHVSLFYMCGQVCKEEFVRIDAKEYEMTLFSRNIFKAYQSPELFKILDNYMSNGATLNETSKLMLDLFESKTKK